MSVDSEFTLSMIRLNHNSAAIDIFGLNSVNVSEGLQELLVAGAGIVDPSFLALSAIEPMISVDASELAKVMAVVGINGLCIGSTQTYTSVDFYFAQVGQCAARLGPSSHLKVSMGQGLIIPTQLQASQGQAASLGLEFHASYDGSNNPITFAVSQSIPTTATIAEQFTLGPVKINGTELKGVQRTTVNFGLNVTKDHGAGQVYPTFLGILTRQPFIEVGTLKATSINTFGLVGTAQGSTDSVVYFRKFEKNASILADGTAEHVSFTVDDGLITVPSTASQLNQKAESTVRITPTYDGTNAILAISTATAIS